MKKPAKITEEKLEQIINDLAEGIKPKTSIQQLYAAIEALADQRSHWIGEAKRFETGLLGIKAAVAIYLP